MTILEHPLAWRWTDPKYAVLPDDVLEKMIPFASEKAAELFKNSTRFNGKNGLADAIFEVEMAYAESMSPDEGRHWLRSQPVLESAQVFLSWQPDTAIMTTWGIFADYWSEFCYGASDDLNVWAEDESWAFLFHHEGEFHFGRRKR